MARSAQRSKAFSRCSHLARIGLLGTSASMKFQVAQLSRQIRNLEMCTWASRLCLFSTVVLQPNLLRNNLDNKSEVRVWIEESQKHGHKIKSCPVQLCLKPHSDVHKFHNKRHSANKIYMIGMLEKWCCGIKNPADEKTHIKIAHDSVGKKHNTTWLFKDSVETEIQQLANYFLSSFIFYFLGSLWACCCVIDKYPISYFVGIITINVLGENCGERREKNKNNNNWRLWKNINEMNFGIRHFFIYWTTANRHPFLKFAKQQINFFAS